MQRRRPIPPQVPGEVASPYLAHAAARSGVADLVRYAVHVCEPDWLPAHPQLPLLPRPHHRHVGRGIQHNCGHKIAQAVSSGSPLRAEGGILHTDPSLHTHRHGRSAGSGCGSAVLPETLGYPGARSAGPSTPCRCTTSYCHLLVALTQCTHCCFHSYQDKGSN